MFLTGRDKFSASNEGETLNPIWKGGRPIFVSVQKSYPAHCQAYGTEILLHLAFEDIGPHLI
jgi:hypothetical protein